MHSATSPAARKSAPDQVSASERSLGPAHAAGQGVDTGSRSKERRKGPRRTKKIDRAVDAPALIERDQSLFPRGWNYVVLGIIVGVVVCGVFAESIPEFSTIFLLLGALLTSIQIHKIHDYVSQRGPLAKIAGLIAAVVVPLGLLGGGIANWASNSGVAWEVAIAVLLGISAVASAYLRRQPIAIFAAQLALWSAVGAAHLTVVGIITLLVSAVIAVLVTREQLIEQKNEFERREAQDRVQTRARDILADYEETGQGWFWETDRRALLTYVSPPVAKALKRNPDRLIGQPLTRLFDLQYTGDEGERTLLFHLSARSAFSELPVRAAIEKEERWWSVSGRPIYDQFDNFVGFRGSGTDLTERKRSQEQATRLARYDALTGLANRLQMSQALEKILSAQSEANRHCAIMLLDLDRFKQVNDTMGHPAGDALLMQVAQRLERAVGKIGQVGRLGGDEFKVIVPNKSPKPVLEEIAHEIIHSLSQPYSIDGQRVVIGASIGIAIAPENGSNSEELIRNADLALYAAKDGGRGRFHFYAEDLHAEAEAKAQLEEDLRDAVANEELELHYQPVVAIATNKISGFEALMRWNHPEKGWVRPDRFISIAEDSGLIQQIGEWALHRACRDLAQWPDEVGVAVNVSPVQFANPALPRIVAAAISQSGIRASRLELEITESVFLGDDDATDAMFAALKRLGVRLALDDFGTGYSSLGYLKKAPFDKIKIDQSFVRGLTEEGSRNRAIIDSITGLANALGMHTTAEGVETHDELDLIRDHGCTHVQGYIFDKPLTFSVAMSRLAGDLTAYAKGPKSSRAPRQKMLRKVILNHSGHVYNGTIRNLSVTGALIEGLWNVPVGTIFELQIADDFAVTCTTRWAREDRMGVEFATPLEKDRDGQITALHGAPPGHLNTEALRKAG